MSFNENQLEKTFIELMEQEGYDHSLGSSLIRTNEEVLIEDDLRTFLRIRYASIGITDREIDSIIRELKQKSVFDLYETNKQIWDMIANGFIFNREDRSKQDEYIQLIDYRDIGPSILPPKNQLQTVVSESISNYGPDGNIYRFVTQLEIQGQHLRIPDGIVYINGLPLVVFEFKSAIREEATIHDAYIQITQRYKRDIPELFKYNAFCVISDGVNSKAGSFFAPYEFYYAWRRIAGMNMDVDGFNSMFTLIHGMFHTIRLRDIIKNFIYFPDSSTKEEKYICRYPQFYATRALFERIKLAQRPEGDGKGGTYFGATGCGKSFTMLYLTRVLMKSEFFASPTIVLITDRTDLDGQLSEQFVEAKKFIGDDTVVSVESRADLRTKLQNRKSGGVFLTTIHKFTEDIELLTDRTNVICISDEAHRSQTNLDQKIIMTETGVRKTYGFAKYLHDSLPNATYVGFTGTPIDATIDVFGEVADAYTMTQSVLDEITVRIVYEGRAAKVNLQNSELEKIEQYYRVAAEAGANEYQIDKSKEQSSTVYAVLGNPERLDVLANDFIQHYEQRVNEGSSVVGKAMFVSSSREIGYEFYKRIIALRPEWNEIKELEGVSADKKKVKPIERVKLVMTRSQDDPKELYELLGTKEEKSELARQFKEADSNFKIAIVVDMWLTGFDVPFLDSIYIDKPIQQHNLIQTISRVNRKYKEKEKGLVVDYIGIKNQMDFALQKYSKGQEQKFEEIEQSVKVVKNQLDLLDNIFVNKCDYSPYFTGAPSEQLSTLNTASDFVLQSEERKSNFMGHVKRLKAAYDICSGSELLTQHERDLSHFFFAVRTIIYKITKGDAPDVAQMNARVREMVNNALNSSGVEEILKIGEEKQKEQDLFDEEYLQLLNKLKLPNTKIEILQKLLRQAITQIKQINKVQGVNFSEKMQRIVEKYNTRDKNDIFRSEVYDEIAESLTDLILQVQNEFTAGLSLGIDLEEKAFYDILFALCVKYNFTYPDDKMIELAKEIKKIVDSQANYPDWNKRDDIKARLKVDIIIILDKYNYPPVTRDEVYMEIFEQAENFKKYRS